MIELAPETRRDENHYVVLLPQTVQEQFLTASELRDFLARILREYPHLQDPDLQRFPDPTSQVQRLIDTTCELDIEQGQTIRWYAVRLAKSGSL